eukprot:m.38490 g.38490  ORF g.38490 m.38490 type:complete len:297 (+) comp32605_c0_seq1:320-1210(+)
MGFFDAFRDRPAHTQYAPQYVAFMGDTLLTGLVVGTVIVLVAFLAIARGQKSVTSAFLTIVRLSLLLLITLAILICIFDPNWKSSSVTTSSQYKAHEKREIKAEIGVGIGLRGLNVTLKGNPANQLNETINYNERFSWAWDQGRLGFGPYAGRINREFRAAQYRGLPLPIQWIVEYFTLDGEEIRWGRAHKEAGYFTNIILCVCIVGCNTFALPRCRSVYWSHFTRSDGIFVAARQHRLLCSEFKPRDGPGYSYRICYVILCVWPLFLADGGDRNRLSWSLRHLRGHALSVSPAIG